MLLFLRILSGGYEVQIKSECRRRVPDALRCGPGLHGPLSPVSRPPCKVPYEELLPSDNPRGGTEHVENSFHNLHPFCVEICSKFNQRSHRLMNLDMIPTNCNAHLAKADFQTRSIRLAKMQPGTGELITPLRGILTGRRLIPQG